MPLPTRPRTRHNVTLQRLETLLADSTRADGGPQADLAAVSRPLDSEIRAKRRSMHAASALLVLMVVGGLILTFSWLTQPGPRRLYPVTAGELSEATSMLVGLRVGDPTRTPAYDRQAFGPAWSDVDHNGCDTRNDILARDLLTPAFKPGTHNCVVLSGTLIDRYTDQPIEFERGQDTSGLVQIDHVVALADSWHQGSAGWDDATRLRFANDPANLLAVDGPANQDKSSLDASQWVPANTQFRCQFAILQIRVKSAYGLGVTAPEAKALGQHLDSCTIVD